MSTSSSELVLPVVGMDCADCALTLERSVAQLDGVEHVQVSFVAGTLQVSGRLDREAIARRVHALGYQVGDSASSKAGPRGERQTFVRFLLRERPTAIALVGALVLLLSAPLALLPSTAILLWGTRVLHVAITVLAGFPIARSGIRALLRGRQITIDLLMTIAAIGAVLIGETGEAATVVVLFAIGEALEGYAADRARASLSSLLSLRPDQATVLRQCVDCQQHLGQDGYTGGPCPFCGQHEVIVPVEQVSIGEIVVVRPGERIPVDGLVVSGASTVNQAPVTGESVPVVRSAGDAVYAGTVNGEAVLEVQVDRLAADSTINRIVRLVEEAQSQRSPMERFIDRFARWYTPAVVAVALILAFAPPLLFGAPFLDRANGARGWLYRALSLLIVACPCSLVISTPVTVVSAMTALARRGVLVKGGIYLDALSGVKVFALDKTGTLTQGQPQVVAARAVDCPPVYTGLFGEAPRCEACDEMLALASTVERRSEHPLAQAIVAEAEARDVHRRYAAADAVQALAGRGVEGQLGDTTVTVGSHSLFHEREADCVLHDDIVCAEAKGQTVMVVGRDNQVLGYVGAADMLRESGRDVLRALKELDANVRVVMLTGDAPPVAQAVAEQAELIDEVRAGLLPGDKLEAIRELQGRYGPVAMIGDGVNDAPALAAADVGVAMGGAGTAQAMETADLVLMRDDLSCLPDAVATSRKTHRVIWQNILFSLVVKAIVMGLALGGQTTLWLAVIADVGTSLLVTANGMRLLGRANRTSGDVS
jgi:Cd2+/Zn2+-exporting ATPase